MHFSPGLLRALLAVCSLAACGGSEATGSLAVSIVSPAPGSALSGTLTVAVELSPSADLFTELELRVDGEPLTNAAAPLGGLPFPSELILDGEHKISVLATTASGSAVSLPVAVEVENLDTTLTPSVPASFETDWNSMAQHLEVFDEVLDANWDGDKHGTIFGAQLFTANCHRGTDLLAPNALAGNAILLDQYAALGFQGVTVAINYPLLMPDFPDSSAYLDFYKSLAELVRERGLYLNFESGVIFGAGDFTTLPVADYYAGKTLEQYIDGRAFVAATIAAELAPDLLLTGAEPDVEASLVGLPVHLLSNAVDLQTAIIQAVDAADPGVSIGAGVGSWLPEASNFTAAYCGIPGFDVVDIHIYPVDNGYLDRASDVAAVARGFGKRVAVSEAWLHKEVGELVGGGEAWATVSAYNAFSFFEPLDRKFLSVLLKWTQHEQVEYVAPYWMQTAFAQLEYDAGTAALEPQEVQALLAQGAAAVLLDNYLSPEEATYSGSGEFLRDMIAWLSIP